MLSVTQMGRKDRDCEFTAGCSQAVIQAPWLNDRNNAKDCLHLNAAYNQLV